VDPIVARKTWRTLEPYHGLVYFAPEPAERYGGLGIEGRDGYFASRAAAMGAVTAEVVIATFFNFDPRLVHRALPAAWERATPAQVGTARLEGIDAALRRVAGDALGDTAAIARAAGLAATALAACHPDGRPLAAAHAGLEVPAEDHLALWHAITVLREFRGDGHVGCLVDAGVDPCEALVLHAATGDVPASILQSTRGWSDDDWAAAVERLRSRGWLDADGSFTEEGRAARQRVEDRTDELALGPWEVLGDDGCEELRALVRPLSKAIVEGGGIGFRPST
jgi:helix-turn-helix protein